MANSNRTLSEVFSRIADGLTGKNREIFAEASDIQLRVDREARIAEVRCSLPRIYRKRDLYALENVIREGYELTQVRILPRYDPALFTLDYMSEALEEAGRIGIVCHGFFDRYTVEGDEENIVISIPFSRGGLTLLSLAETAKVIEGIVFSEFGRQIRVELKQSGDAEEEYAAYMSRQLEKLNASSAAILEQEARFEAMAQSSSAPVAVEEEKPVLPRADSLLEGNAEAEELPDNRIRCGRITFDCSEPKLVFGEEFPIRGVKPLRSIRSAARGAVILCEVFAVDQKETRRGDKVMFTFAATDREASIYIKVTVPAESAAETEGLFSKGKQYAVRGTIKSDKFDNDLYMQFTDIMQVKEDGRRDRAPEKRVELHLHTNMSTMDALIKADDIVNTAAKWGHKAIAITDHGNLQSFPIAMLANEKLENPIKILYGIEAYYVDDTARAAYRGEEIRFDGEFAVFDIETTGLSAATNRITEIGAVLFKNGEVAEKFNTFVDPECHIPENITELTGITDEMVKDAPKEKDALEAFFAFVGDRMLVAHNAAFDTGFIRQASERCGMPFENPYLDTLAMSRYLNPSLKNHKLDTLAKHYNLGDFNHHRASDDAEMLALIFGCMVERLQEDGVEDIARLNYMMAEKADPLKLKTFHQIILVKNAAGLKNLYKLVSDSYLKYYYRHPRIPRTRLEELREGLILGSACSEGELFRAIQEGKPEADLIEIAQFYDYLEIQPISNNEYLIREGSAADEEALRNYNRKIVELGRKANRPVCATCDAHYKNPEDEIYRRIILSGQGFKDADRETKLFFRTTEEMLEEFAYLGEETAREVVITNPNKIADMIEDVRPIPKGNYPPHIDGAEEELTTKCWSLAKEMYGDPLPEVVSARLKRELDSIISNGFAIMYIIARKLVENSEEKGYQVGSRGSVGSSFAATMGGITRVNPLPPHYRCPKCRWSEFFENGEVGSGFDLPPKKCPVCGEDCERDGHDIPFETFLGFKGDKTPDIDLNFSGDVQGAAHKFTEVLFGTGHAFKAGTIGTLADKTAYGYAAHFLEDRGISVNRAEMDRLVNGCMGVKKNTGQHPGGVIVVPAEYEIYDFSPVQHPSDNKAGAEIITTHFAFTYLHDTILKLDILGHDIPTKYKRLEEYTGVKVTDVPLSDPACYEGLTSTAPIGVTPEQIDSQTSTIGLPEFGTQFIRGVLMKAQPKTFADILQIMGLTHGTGCWLGNAEELINQKICTISEVIGCRDDIMMTLIHKYGMEKSLSFKIMEFVRKNKKGLIIPDEMQSAMRENGVPEWYIDSLQKIRYMFPKAHAAAYGIDTVRLMWYKINYPVEFYAAYFTAAPDGLDGEVVMKGRRFCKDTYQDLKKRGKEKSATEAALEDALMLVNECFERGYDFLPVDINKSHATKFLPENGKIRLPFTSLPGLGGAAAESIMNAMRSGTILSVEDLRVKAKVSKSILELLDKTGALRGMSQSNQLSMF
ncbi:MAG: PolC-type DNA polymerase III [Ruminococcaceae bacterium]|jgi:DNA polymerase-3 subunit alpha (Gram-positive type)|nr:PolC-type DNA polymerase III [Oscillospiraceae bacterium]